MVEKKLSWKEVRQVYEKKTHHKLKIHDFSTPELVKAYIEKYRFPSSSAEIIFSIYGDKDGD